MNYKIIYFFLIFFHRLSFGGGFLLSVIMAIYNTGKYLDDSIGSLLNQSISFQKIQLILVNDGSSDFTEEICLKYKKIYQKNIIYIKIAHKGVSKARNIGMKYANGKYINFLDADDKWDYNAFKYILLFFKYYKDIDMVSGRIKFFGAEDNYHPLDYKFSKTRIVNLKEEYSSIQLSASSSIFKKSLIKRKFFNEEIYFCEDSEFVNNILLIKPVMGLIKEAIYYYRRRIDFSSSVQSQKQSQDFYFGTVNFVLIHLINSSKTLYNMILPFIQFLVGYDLLFRIQSQAYKYLDSDRFRKYNILVEDLLKQIEDKYILEQKILSNKYKIFALSKKYHKDLRYNLKLENNSFTYSNYTMINLKEDKNIISLRRLNIQNNILYLEAIDNLWIPSEKYFYFSKLGNIKLYPKYFDDSTFDIFTLNGLSQKGRILSFEIPLDINSSQILYFYLSYMDINIEIFTSLGFYSHIPPINNGYYTSGKFILKYINKRLTFFNYNQKLEIEFERLYCYELIKAKKDYIIHLRKQVKFRKQNHDNFEIWIINDRYDRAGDNGEYFFRYLKIKKPKGIKFFFAIKINCSDYKRLKNFGNILDLNSEKYKKFFLKSNKIISSVSYPWAYNPFNYDRKYYRDLFNFDFVFLQNGIIKDDLSKSLNKLEKNFSIFVTSTKREYKSVLQSNYGYNEKNVILTGMPRYDYLQLYRNISNIGKNILITPTWRANIKGTRDLKTYESKYLDNFNSTEFFQFYNNLINDKRLLLFMKKNNFTGKFCLHPFFESQWINFNQNEIFSVVEKCNFVKLVLEASLLITDYSSIFFDFAYIRKPIIYAHFDYNDYRNNHYKESYFDYSRDGFGPVCKNIKCVIDEIIFEIENKCLIQRKFLKRMNNFFTFNDDKNNERIFNMITKRKNLAIQNDYNYIFLIIINILFLKLINNSMKFCMLKKF